MAQLWGTLEDALSQTTWADHLLPELLDLKNRYEECQQQEQASSLSPRVQAPSPRSPAGEADPMDEDSLIWSPVGEDPPPEDPAHEDSFGEDAAAEDPFDEDPAADPAGPAAQEAGELLPDSASDRASRGASVAGGKRLSAPHPPPVAEPPSWEQEASC